MHLLYTPDTICLHPHHSSQHCQVSYHIRVRLSSSLLDFCVKPKSAGPLSCRHKRDRNCASEFHVVPERHHVPSVRQLSDILGMRSGYRSVEKYFLTTKALQPVVVQVCSMSVPQLVWAVV